MKKNPWIKVGFGLAVGLHLGKVVCITMDTFANRALKKIEQKLTEAEPEMEETKEETAE